MAILPFRTVNWVQGMSQVSFMFILFFFHFGLFPFGYFVGMSFVATMNE